MFETSSILSFLTSFGTLGIFLTIALGGEILLLVAGILVSFDYLNFFEIVFAATFGVVLIDSLWYFLGRTGREISFLKNIGKKFIKEENYKRWQQQFGKHSVKTLLFLRIIYGFRAFILMAAGVTKMQFSKFFLFNFLGSLIWAVIFTLLGYFFGQSFSFLKNIIKEIYIFLPLTLGICLITIFLIYLLKKKITKKF